MWHLAKRILLGLSLLLILGLGAAFAVVQSHGGKLLSVQTGSMVPQLHKGDLVATSKISPRQLGVGDVITYVNPRNPKQTITHRIIQTPNKANLGKFIVKGDANPAADPPVDSSAIVGKLHFHTRYLGFAVDFVRKPLGLAILIYVPALLIIIDELKRLARYYKEQEPYRIPGRLVPPTRRKHGVVGSVVTVLALGFGLSFVLPVQAALFSQATLTGNRIFASAPANHILIRQVDFECSRDNTGTVNKLPSILFYNPTAQDISTGNWTLKSSAGTITTFRPQTIFDAHDDYDIEPDLTAGVKYTGDFLALFDNTGKLVDAISWGTDTSFLNPPLPGIQDGSQFRRVSLITNTNTVSDWAVSVNSCVAG